MTANFHNPRKSPEERAAHREAKLRARMLRLYLKTGAAEEALEQLRAMSKMPNLEPRTVIQAARSILAHQAGLLSRGPTFTQNTIQLTAADLLRMASGDTAAVLPVGDTVVRLPGDSGALPECVSSEPAPEATDHRQEPPVPHGTAPGPHDGGAADPEPEVGTMAWVEWFQRQEASAPPAAPIVKCPACHMRIDEGEPHECPVQGM